MPTVTALVCAYWPKREGNLRQGLTDLQTSTRPPDRIIVLDNNVDRRLDSMPPGIDYLKPSWNTTCRGKFLAALLTVADYYLLLDDDTSVHPTTIARLLEYATPDLCTGYLGVHLGADGSFHHGGRLWPHDATAVTRVDTFCGCAMFMSFRALCNMVSLEGWVRTSSTWPDEGDDIIAGLANDSVILPLAKEDGFKDLGYQDEAMCYSIPNYYEMRDAFTQDVLRARSSWLDWRRP